MHRQIKVSVLMATYNGEAFIKLQLDSLLAQTHTNWELIIRDDGSSDKTIDIINAYCSKDNRITLIINETSTKGACANFSVLLSDIIKRGSFNYIMFCDQDDIWKSGKIKTSVNSIVELEHRFKNKPILIYSDLELMNSAGNIIPGQLKLKNKIRLNNLISFNYVYGCTMIFNLEMAVKIGDIPFTAKNHDFWIALVASSYHTSFINEKLIRYRQHGNNASGNVAGNNSLMSRINRLILNPQYEIFAFSQVLDTLEKFSAKYGHTLNQKDQLMLKSYLEAFRKNRLAVCYRMIANRIFRNGFFQTLASFYLVFFFYKKIKAKAQL